MEEISSGSSFAETKNTFGVGLVISIAHSRFSQLKAIIDPSVEIPAPGFPNPSVVAVEIDEGFEITCQRTVSAKGRDPDEALIQVAVIPLALFPSATSKPLVGVEAVDGSRVL